MCEKYYFITDVLKKKHKLTANIFIIVCILISRDWNCRIEFPFYFKIRSRIIIEFKIKYDRLFFFSFIKTCNLYFYFVHS